MTPRPVEEILAQAQREGWPTSSIDAMANYHLCSRPYVKECFTGPTAGEGGQGEARQDTAPTRTPGAVSAHPTQEATVADSTCDTCDGTGQVDKVEMTQSGLIRRGKAPCPDC